MNNDKHVANQGRLFHFKQFSLSDSGCAMKIGTDGVLLGAFAARAASGIKPEYILDIGTGCGLIALMMAQKCNAAVHAIDIDAQAANVAAENFSNSPWAQQLHSFHCSLQQFTANVKYDIIASNPPYFQDALHSPDTTRTTARHNKDLRLEELFYFTGNLLTANGKFIIIYPVDNITDTEKISSSAGFWEHERLFIQSSPKHAPKRIISVYSLIKTPGIHSRTMAIETGERHNFSEEYKTLAADYHPFL